MLYGLDYESGGDGGGACGVGGEVGEARGEGLIVVM